MIPIARIGRRLINIDQQSIVISEDAGLGT